ncbi:MAG: hypothetical protein M3272_03765 [Actinomycetota bacterium]|nr:hypothetical protein [Actinomycetota bacterium]
MVESRALVAFEDQYRTYREFIASAIRWHRPHVEVAVAGLEALKDEVARFDPDLVICSRPNTLDSNGRPAWFELPPDPERLAELCLNGRRSEMANPALEELLRAVDETERLIRTKPYSAKC